MLSIGFAILQKLPAADVRMKNLWKMFNDLSGEIVST